MAAISKRRGLVTNTESRDDIFILNADCPLSQMFGFATELRGMTAGQVFNEFYIHMFFYCEF